MVTKDIDLSEFEEEPPLRKCLVGAFLESLSDEDQAKFAKAFVNRALKTAIIHKRMQTRPGGEDLKNNLVLKHRNRVRGNRTNACSCL